MSRAGGGRRSLLRLLVEGSRALEGRLYEGLRAVGFGDVRPAHYAVFRYLEDETSRVTELAEAAGMTKQSMGELVDYLERRGYVERHPDPRDGRAKIVTLTEKGQRGIEAAAERLAEIEAELAGRMGNDRLEELIGSLANLGAILAEEEQKPRHDEYGDTRADHTQGMHHTTRSHMIPTDSCPGTTKEAQE